MGLIVGNFAVEHSVEFDFIRIPTFVLFDSAATL
jgi:hypothetical protein